MIEVAAGCHSIISTDHLLLPRLFLLARFDLGMIGDLVTIRDPDRQRMTLSIPSLKSRD